MTRVEAMKPVSPTIDVRFRNYVQLQLRRHLLLAEGKEDASETAEVEDLMGDVWDRLDEAQRHGVKGVGSDLNWIRRKGAPPPKGRPAEAVTGEDVRLLADAETRKDWHSALHYLRVCAPALAIEDLARRRVVAYSGVGLPECADACRAASASR